MNDCGKRIAAVRAEIMRRGLDAFLVTAEANVSYLSGFDGSDSLLVISRDSQPLLVTDSRFIEDAKESLKGFGVELVKKSTYETIKKIFSRRSFKKVGFEAMNLPFGVMHELKKLAPAVRYMPTKGFIESFRSIKDAREIALVKLSARAARGVLDAIARLIRPGLTERDVCGSIEVEFIKRGARAAFAPIVASGKNSSRPHARPTQARIAKDSCLMIDLGARLDGYHSDITRMFFLGSINRRMKKLVDTVRLAQEKAFENIRPGRLIASVDRAARDVIARHGYGRYFGHSLGHGVGLEVHEDPTISGLNQGVLKQGMVFTVEPAIYLPGFGGVRIEDMVAVTESGYEILT